MSYQSLAPLYDRLNAHAPYQDWVRFLDECMQKFLPQKPQLVLDLACGTGKITRGLAKLGYEMIGVDASAEMLSEAYSKQGDQPILYLQQTMQSFELYGTVGAVVCCLDSLNYLLTLEDLTSCISLVHNYLDPNGLFVFDMNTPYQFENNYGEHDYILESKAEPTGENKTDLFCGWRNHYDPKTRLCDFSLTFFEGKNGLYKKTKETQTERCYSWQEITNTLKKCGMELLVCYKSLKMDVWDEKENVPRWFVVARCIK